MNFYRIKNKFKYFIKNMKLFLNFKSPFFVRCKKTSRYLTGNAFCYLQFSGPHKSLNIDFDNWKLATCTLRQILQRLKHFEVKSPLESLTRRQNVHRSRPTCHWLNHETLLIGIHQFSKKAKKKTFLTQKRKKKFFFCSNYMQKKLAFLHRTTFVW